MTPLVKVQGTWDKAAKLSELWRRRRVRRWMCMQCGETCAGDEVPKFIASNCETDAIRKARLVEEARQAKTLMQQRNARQSDNVNAKAKVNANANANVNAEKKTTTRRKQGRAAGQQETSRARQPRMREPGK